VGPSVRTFHLGKVQALTGVRALGWRAILEVRNAKKKFSAGGRWYHWQARFAGPKIRERHSDRSVF
jgi:hypothetical protein